jgi:DNA-binding MarR family transcriptional regulator
MLTMSARAPRRPPASAAFLSIVQAAEELQRGIAELLKTRDLTLAQYNVLRILRGAGPEGATCGSVSENLVRHDPDVTRLVDRLDKRGLVDRARDTKDRRVVRTRITRAGAALLAELDDPVDELHARQLGHLSSKRLADLVAILDETRAKLP